MSAYTIRPEVVRHGLDLGGDAAHVGVLDRGEATALVLVQMRPEYEAAARTWVEAMNKIHQLQNEEG